MNIYWTLIKDTLTKRKAKRDRDRGADELFSTGEIFNATSRELNNVLKEVSTSPVLNDAIKHQKIIRAITVLSIRNERYTRMVQYFNIIISVILLFIALKTLVFTQRQTEYTAVSTIDERIRQAQLRQSAMEECARNPDKDDSGLAFENGKPVSCKDLLKLR